MRRFAILLTVLLGVIFFSSLAFAETIEFTVKKGDNFWTLAKKYQVKHQALIALNRDKLKNPKNPNLIYPGQKFTVKLVSVGTKSPAGLPSLEKVSTVKVENEKAPAKSLAVRKIKVDKKVQNVSMDHAKNYFIAYTFFVSFLSFIVLAFIFKEGRNRNKINLSSLNEKNITPENVVIDGDTGKENFLKDEFSRSDNYRDVDPERCFVGIDEDKILHCIGDEQNMIIGTYDQVAKFSVSMCREECRKYLVLMEDAEFAKVFGLRPLDADEKRQLELSISRELELLTA